MGDIKTLIGINLRAICKAKGIKQVDIARALGVAEGNVSNWFRGTNLMDIDTLAEICKFIGVSMNDIFGYVDPEKLLTADEMELIKKYRSLGVDGRQALESYLNYLLHCEETSEKNDAGAV